MGYEWQEVANRFGTPLYVYDFDAMIERYRQLKEAFAGKKSLINYAVKANSNLSVIARLAQEGAGADCVSIGEVQRAIDAGVDRYKIIFSGVGKRDDEIKQALNLGILLINVESEAELKRIEMIAAQANLQARISVRVNPDIDPQTHPYISTGLHENKFGVDIDTAKRLYLYAKHSKWLDPVGIHFHIGSQLTQLDPIKEACTIVADLTRSLIALDVEIRFFDVGGGLGVVYRNEETIDPSAYATTIIEATKGLDVTYLMEPGRFITANAGFFLTRVLYEKHNGTRRFVIVDGAMNDLLRPSLYDAYHKIEAVGTQGDETLADVVGPVCESGDFLAKGVALPPMEHGDVLVVHSAGAYGFSMASNYNTRPRPAEVAIENGAFRLIRRRESYEDLIALEKPFLEKR